MAGMGVGALIKGIVPAKTLPGRESAYFNVEAWLHSQRCRNENQQPAAEWWLKNSWSGGVGRLLPSNTVFCRVTECKVT